MTTRVAITGATGKLGGVVRRLVEDDDGFELVAAMGSSSPLEEMEAAEVLVDVTRPEASPGLVEHALGHGLNVLVGTSGWSAERLDGLRGTLEGHPGQGVVVVPNFSLGSALATSLASVAARFYDSIEIVEAHGPHKVDSPSGTAVRTAELMAAARGDRGPVEAPHTDQRARGEQVAGIPVHSLRGSGIVARQEVLFGGEGERVTIAHDTLSSSAYEAGILVALRAARGATGLTVGLENLIDLGLAR